MAVAPMLLMMEVLKNLQSNGQFDSVAVELEGDDLIIITHRVVDFSYVRCISLAALPEYLPDREEALLARVMEINMHAEASLVQQAMPADTTIH